MNGWTNALDAIEADVAAAKALMADAGYGDGFSIMPNCPNDRYINDEAICQAAVGMFGQIGIKVNLDAKPKAQHFLPIKNKTTSSTCSAGAFRPSTALHLQLPRSCDDREPRPGTIPAMITPM